MTTVNRDLLAVLVLMTTVTRGLLYYSCSDDNSKEWSFFTILVPTTSVKHGLLCYS
jgi:hypothetical protein